VGSDFRSGLSAEGYQKREGVGEKKKTKREGKLPTTQGWKELRLSLRKTFNEEKKKCKGEEQKMTKSKSRRRESQGTVHRVKPKEGQEARGQERALILKTHIRNGHGSES